MTSSRYQGFIFSLLVTASALGAQDRGAIRQLGPVVAKSTEPVGVASVRPSASGILVNDLAKRRVIFFDTTLAKFT
ncbi:MAG: hypothetical protein H0W69_06825, partial [Gemmatimonadaceae bacterium]|nr:hypothetical protein [Gemmatimonadaceae bacterium]